MAFWTHFVLQSAPSVFSLLWGYPFLVGGQGIPPAIASLLLSSFVIIGFVVAHFVHNIPSKGQRKWRGMLLVPWVIPAALSMLGWRLLFEPSFGALNWGLEHFGFSRVFWLGEAAWARFCVVLVTVWFGAPFFMVMYLASLKSVPGVLRGLFKAGGAPVTGL